MVISIQAKLNSDYESFVVPFAEAYKERTGGKAVMTFDLFKRASSLIASRAFGVDAYHRDSMLPIADIFNHTCNEHVHIECDGDVCTECGSPDPCQHTIQPKKKGRRKTEEESREDEEDEERTPKRKRKIKIRGDEDNEEEDEESPRPEGLIPSKYALSIVMVRPRRSCFDTLSTKVHSSNPKIREAASGEELYNTYGPLPNVVLLNKHGFVEIPNIHDCVRCEQIIYRRILTPCSSSGEHR